MTQLKPMPIDIAPALVQFSAMVFDVTPPDVALQSLAELVGVSTCAIGRIDNAMGTAQILAQNGAGLDVRGRWQACVATQEDHYVALSDDQSCDVLIVQSALSPLTDNQLATLKSLSPYLVAFWRARKQSFENSLTRLRAVTQQSMLHPDNPFDLTRTEQRICQLIADGNRPKDIAKTLDQAMPTVRTHLRNIYTKTGLDGMFSVLHHIQTFSTTHEAA